MDGQGMPERCGSLLHRARGYLEDAAMLIAAGSFESAVNRCYYAAHAAARALLALRGIEPGSHEGLLEAVRGEFAAPGSLAADSIEALHTLLARRNSADYGDDRIGRGIADDSLDLARRFVRRAGELVGAPPKTP